MDISQNRNLKLMIVGSQKTGTSSLLRYLSQHPEIYAHPQPEMTFFLQDHEYERGYNWAYKKYYAKSQNDQHLIAKNVMVMCSIDIMKRIYKHNPNIQLVVLLREPIARAYSAYWWARRRGWENIKTFEEALQVEEKRLEEDWFKWRQCLYKYNSTYYPLIIDIIKLFGKENVRCILTDDLKDDAVKTCQELYDIMGVSNDFLPKVEIRHNEAAMARSEKFGFLFTQFLASRNPIRRAIRGLVPDQFAYKIRNVVLNLNNKPFTAPPINPDTYEQLRRYFQPYNNQLSILLERDLSHW
ncbi:hypothetical protein C6497_02335 [Candidatus Poribacteria bacterium]|nr:MAG: hypothetical protein C6497_02335 [Candidatus Poribacteria bacterium]